MLLLWALTLLLVGLAGGLWAENYGVALAGLIGCAVMVTAYFLTEED